MTEREIAEVMDGVYPQFEDTTLMSAQLRMRHAGIGITVADPLEGALPASLNIQDPVERDILVPHLKRAIYQIEQHRLRNAEEKIRAELFGEGGEPGRGVWLESEGSTVCCSDMVALLRQIADIPPGSNTTIRVGRKP